jgi:NAD-dependent deacetylase
MHTNAPTLPAELATALREARHIVVFTGAGVSAESGIPTFRDALTGLWSRFDAMALATPEAFLADPALVWGWYEWRRLKVRQARPNPAHHAIADLAHRVPRLTLVTQNVDDLHERASSPAEACPVLHLQAACTSPAASTAARPSSHPPTPPRWPTAMPRPAGARRRLTPTANACPHRPAPPAAA